MMAPRAYAKSTADFLADGYLVHLLSYSLETLRKEPCLLKSQEAALEQELQDTTKQNHQGFIEAASCFHEVSKQVQQVSQELQGLADALQSLHEHASSLAASSVDYKVRMQAFNCPDASYFSVHKNPPSECALVPLPQPHPC
jgi:hypothetical protein